MLTKYIKFKDYHKMYEAFDKPYDVKKTTDLPHYVNYEFETPDQSFDIVYLRPEGGDYTVMSFETEYGEMDLTGGGDAFRIFATVLETLKKEAKNIKKYGKFVFKAKTTESSRVKLYRRMSKQIQKLLKYKNLTIKEEKYDVVFSFSD